MESEERECREYEADLINGTDERETIDQGIDEMEGKHWNEGIRTMALMEFMASLYSRGGSEEPRGRPCDDLVRRPLHSSVPSSPVPASSSSSSSTSRLWGSFRGKTKPPVIDKRALSPFLKTAS